MKKKTHKNDKTVDFDKYFILRETNKQKKINEKYLGKKLLNQKNEKIEKNIGSNACIIIRK